jgi:hypothetical protein
MVTQEDWAIACHDVNYLKTNVLQISELDRKFPIQELMNDINIIYLEY